MRRREGGGHIDKNERPGSEVETFPKRRVGSNSTCGRLRFRWGELVGAVGRRDTLYVPVVDGSQCLVALITWETWRQRPKEMTAVYILQHLPGAQEGEKYADRYPQNKQETKRRQFIHGVVRVELLSRC